MAKFKYSAQVSGYVPKALKQRMAVLREIDPKRYSESSVVEDCIVRGLAKIEAEASSFKVPTQRAPGRKTV